MTSLLVSLFIALGLSALIASLSVRVVDRLERDRDIEAGSRIAIWRMARFAALAPIAMALVFSLFPQLTTAFQAPDFLRPTASAPVEQVEPFAVDERAAATPAASEQTMARVAADAGAQADPRPAQDNGAGALAAEAGFTLPAWMTPMNVLLAAYLSGLLLALGRFALRRMALAGLIATSQQPRRELRSMYEQWRGRLELESSVSRLVVVDAAITPFVTGWQPTIVLPRSLADETQRQAAEIAVVHELIHVRRGDERDRFVGELLTVALWFNPALKAIESRLSHARELACDAEALKEIGGRAQRRAYARAMIDAAKAGLRPAPCLSAFGPDNKRNREMRIKAILSQSTTMSSKTFLAAAGSALALMMAPTYAAQAMATNYLQADAPAVVAATASTLTAAVVTEREGDTAIRRTLNASPLAALSALESLEALENIDESSIIGNPANWMAIGAFASGASSTLNLNIEDENGNPVRISINESDGDLVNIEFTDDEGRRNHLRAHDRGGDDAEVTLFLDDQEDPFFQIVAADDEANMLFRDDVGPVRMQVRDEDDDATIIVTDELSGESTELFFQDNDDGRLLAPANGRVSHVGTDEPGPDSVGQYVVIDHGSGWSTVYHGLESVEVRQGARISRGDLIGTGDPDYDHDWDPMDSDDSFNSIDVVDNTSMSIVRTSQVEL